jgi:hypothetical protein
VTQPDIRSLTHFGRRVLPTTTRALISASVILLVASQTSAQGLSDDPFVDQVIGEWQGQGQFDGNRLDLTRSWALALQGQFLRVDMRVTMSNGSSFAGLMYWRSAGDGVYDIQWMDASGRSQGLRGTRDPETGLVSTTFLDEMAEHGPEWRTWEFESRGADAYVERLYRESSDGRELLAEFSFARAAGSSR